MAAKNEAKIRFTAETGDFNQNIKKANNELSSLRAEAKLNAAQMKATGTTVEGLQTKQKNLSDQLEATRDKAQALSDKLAVATEIFGENSDEATKLRNQLLAVQTSEARLQTAIEDCNTELSEMEAEQNRVKTASEKLSDEIAGQEAELADLKDAYVDAVLEFGEASDEAQDLAGQIDNLSSDLRDNRNRMNDAESAANDLDNSIDDAADAASDAASGGFTVFKGALADLVSEGIQSAIGKIGELFDYFAQLPAETLEARQDMSTLVTAFDNVGFATETATDTWKDLYAVFGEDDRAVEAANNIARMADNEQELNDWVTITTGIWGTYQDSLPVEGLAEAAGETAKVGTVTGVLADALNWSSEAAVMFADYMGGDVVTAEDAFNAALAECTTEQERQALITDTLTALYGGAADTYRETSAAQMEAKEATAAQMLAEQNLATAIEPVTTAWTNMKIELLVGILPAVQAVSGALLTTMTWLQEHPVVLKVLAGVLGVVAAAIAALTIVTTAQTIAQWALNSAILANPITWVVVGIVAAIAAVVAIIVVMIEYWDQIVAAVSTAVDAVKETLSAWCEWINTSIIQPVAEFFSGLWDSIVGVFQSVVDWVSVNWQSILMFLINPFAGAFSYMYENFEGFRNFVNGIVTAVGNFFVNLWSGVKNGASNAWEGIKSVFSSVATWFGNIFSTAWTAVKNVFSTGGQIFAGIKDGIVNAFKAVVNVIIRGLNRVVSIPFNGLNNILNRLNGLSFLGISPFSWLTWRAPVPQIPLLAEGGILTRATLNIAGEAGPEAVIPIDKLQSYIDTSVERAMQAVNIQALAVAIEDLANRPVQLNVNGRQFAVATASDTDRVNGNRLALTRRGLALS